VQPGAMPRASRERVAAVKPPALLMAVCLAGACAGVPTRARSPALDAQANRVRAMADEYVAAYKTVFPELAEDSGLTLAHHDALSDNSRAALDAWHAREDVWAAELRKIDPEALWGTPEWVLYGYLRNTVDSSRATRVCHAELWPAHEYGWQIILVAMIDKQPIGTPALRNEALARWRQLPRFLETEIANLREGARLGYTAPRRNVELAIEGLDALVATELTKSPLWSPAKRDPDPGFRAQWKALVEADLLPAARRYRDFLRDDYVAKARTTLGLTGIPNGEACYRGSLRTYTTADIDPTTLYRRGEERVAEREARALALAHKLLGDGVTDLRAVKAMLDEDPRNRFAGPAEVLRFVGEALARAREAAPRWFVRTPRAAIALVPYDVFEAKSRPSARYEPAARDGSRPARYRIDVTNPESWRRVDLENTAFHEAIPGHHLQIGLGQELPGQHELVDISFTSAFAEGWARYGEGLSDEMGLYSTDLDWLGAVAHLPTGMVLDPGIHALGWSRERAIAYVLQKQIGFTPVDAASYVDRIAIWPGQMVSYGVGELEILTLRRQAEAELGRRFDIKGFHECVLAHGAITLPMLRQAVTHWIAEESSAHEPPSEPHR
jgi:uncharacterized protein (DUF885 family)